jgi:hypothetical protein
MWTGRCRPSRKFQVAQLNGPCIKDLRVLISLGSAKTLGSKGPHENQCITVVM